MKRATSTNKTKANNRKMTQAPPQETPIWPSEIRLAKTRDCLDITFDNDVEVSLSAELLRVESPSAEVQGHGAGQKITPPGKRLVKITGIEPVGNYAVRLAFDDGHDTGIFSWALLYDYGQRQDQLMADYLERLRAAGTSRDPH